MKVTFRPLPVWPHPATPPDRYGVTSRGQQYAGFLQLGPGGPDAARGAQLVQQHGGIRAALMATHPDHGGDPRDFADVQAFREREGDA